MTTVRKWGPEFLLNTTTTNAQRTQASQALADGRFVVVWEDFSQTDSDTSGFAIRGQIFNADGTWSGAEFVVNTATTGDQLWPTITALADGKFVVAWADFSNGTSYDIRAQVYNTNGSRSGSEFLVNSSVTGDQIVPTIAGLADGRFVVTWQDFSNGSNNDILAQVFNTNGSFSGPEFVVNTTLTNGQFEPVITVLADGRFLVAWIDRSNGTDDDIRAQVYNADGSLSGAEFLVNATVTSAQIWPAVTALADGGFVVTWGDYGSVLGYEIIACVFNPDGSAFGDEFLVNTTLSFNQATPTIAALADGRFVVAWADGSNGVTADIRAQVFNADGSKSGSEFLVNTTVAGGQDAPTITTFADGRFLVAWSDNSNAGDSDIFGQIFDPREAAISLNGTLAADDFIGTQFADRLGGFFGDDTLAGAAGDDLMFGGIGNDLLTGGAGNDQIDGGDGGDRLNGGNASDGLDGGAGNDTLNGGFGTDAAAGGAGNDLYMVDLAGDLVIEAAGAGGGVDRVLSATLSLNLANYVNVENATVTGALALNLTGSGVANLLTGNGVANRMFGLGGNDRLTGNNGNDTLDGSAGTDTLQGGLGQDLLAGGTLADVFVFAAAAEAGNGVNRDRITDFQAGVDHLDFSAFMAGGSFIGNGAFVVGNGPQVRFVPASGLVIGDVNGDRVLDLSIQLDGSPVLTAADFVF